MNERTESGETPRYVVTGNLHRRNAHYRRCLGARRPFIAVRVRGQTVRAVIDMETVRAPTTRMYELAGYTPELLCSDTHGVLLELLRTFGTRGAYLAGKSYFVIGPLRGLDPDTLGTVLMDVAARGVRAWLDKYARRVAALEGPGGHA